MSVSQCVGDLGGDLDGLAHRQPAALIEHVTDRPATHELHHDRLAVVAGTRVEDRDDVRVGQAGGGHGFATETLDEGVVGGQVGEEDLGGDGPGEDGVLRFPDLGHAASGDAADELVAASDTVPGGEGHVRRRISGRRRHDGSP
jgi:hypothetical protein